MTRDDEKRKLREAKRELKRAGRKKARSRAKQLLETAPEEAHLRDDTFGRYSTAHLNGMDHDSTRRNHAGSRTSSRPKGTSPGPADLESREPHAD